MSKEIKFIYGVSDKTGECPFYTDFYKNESEAIKGLEKQMDYAHLEFGMENLNLKNNKVYSKNKIVFSIDKFKLK